MSSGGYSEQRVYAIIESMSQSDHIQQSKQELFATVIGRVQGVGFRDFVEEHAQRLGLRGYTRNEHTGEVTVVAQGIRPALEQLLVRLRQGPSAAQVQDVQTQWREPTEHFSGFHIRW